MIKKPAAMGVAKPADRRLIAVVAAGVSLFIALLFYTLKPGGDRALTIFSDLAPVAVAAWAAIMAFVLFSQTKAEDPVRVVWLLMALSLVCDFSGEATWAALELGFKIEVPYPSLADIGWILGYPLFFLALHRQLRLLRAGKIGKELSSIVGFGVVGIFLLVFIVLRPVLQSGEITWVEKALDIYYPLFSFVNFIAALWLVVYFGKGVLEEGWLLIGLSFFFRGVGDTAYAYLTSRELYTMIGDVFSDLSWILSYLLLALGFSFIRVRTK